MQTLTITVSGHAGVGKSRISMFIANALRDRGFNVEIEPTDTPEFLLKENLNEVINNLESRVNIVLKEVQQPR